jgi:predicted nuclease with TOPRIM domain
LAVLTSPPIAATDRIERLEASVERLQEDVERLQQHVAFLEELLQRRAEGSFLPRSAAGP